MLPDAIGSTRALADNTGAVQTSYTYEPFGYTSTSGVPSSNALQYTGRENDGLSCITTARGTTAQGCSGSLVKTRLDSGAEM